MYNFGSLNDDHSMFYMSAEIILSLAFETTNMGVWDVRCTTVPAEANVITI